VPGKTMPAITVVERDYPNTYARKFTASARCWTSLGNGGKGIGWNTSTKSTNSRS
jgi:nitrate reductase alpha subunit